MALVVTAVMAFAVLAGVALFYRDHGHVFARRATADSHAAAATPADPRPPLLAKDRQFLFSLAAEGIEPSGTRDATIKDAHRVCLRVARGETEQQIVQDIISGSPAMTAKMASTFAGAAIDVYCPQA